MRKYVKMLISALGLCMLFTGCNNDNKNFQNNTGNNMNNQSNQSQGKQNTQNQQKEEKKINEEYDVSTEIKEVIENTRLSSIENIENEKVAKIDFSDLKGVTYEHIEEITENEITEVWLIKMSNFNQYDKIVKKINNCLEDLKGKYSDNKFITSILSSKDNIRIQEKEGIVMAAIAPDAGALLSGMEQTLVEEPIEPEIEEITNNESGEVIEEVTNNESGEIIEDNKLDDIIA